MIEYCDTFTQNEGPGYYNNINLENIITQNSEELPTIFIDEDIDNDE